MQKTSRKALSLLLSLVLALSLVAPVTQVAYAAATEVNGGETINESGEYTLPDGATGTITIATREPVTIIGSGVAWDENFNYTSDTVKYTNLKFDCTVERANLTLKDLYIEDKDGFSGASPLVNFTGEDNSLNIEGTVVLDKMGNGGFGKANIHVDEDTTLTIGGSGTLYLYKTSGGAGIGGNKGEMNGDITFAMTGSAFIKGTKQGAVIGAGTGANGSGEPGWVTFESGEYNLISNSRGAVIGGSAGSAGASEGTVVRIFGGTVNINVDYSGTSVGGGGYDAGSDANGGTVTITGGWTENAYAGGIAGNFELGTVTGCLNVGTVTAQGKRVGGIVGGQGNGKALTIENCGNIGAISGDSAVGGIIGCTSYYYDSAITGCLNAGKVTATTAASDNGVGGIAGYIDGINVTDVYNLGDVSCTDKTASATMGVGGIIGYASEATLKNAYNAGAISAAGSASAGALIGAQSRYSITVNNSYYLPVDGLAAHPAGKNSITNVASKTEAELKALASTLGSKFKANSLGYPLLTWQPDAVAEVPATCTEAGNGAYYLGANGKCYSDPYGLNEIEQPVLPANGHGALTKTDMQPATCTASGHAAYWTCPDCGQLFSDAEGKNPIEKPAVIAALNHKNATLVPAKAPNCTETGHAAYWVCPDCGKFLADNNGEMDTGKVYDNADSFTVPAKGHGTLTATSAKAPTCTEDGHEAYWTCPDCGQLFSDAEGKNPIEKPTVIAALNYKNATLVPAKPATCAEDGHAAYWVCPDCGKFLADNNGEMDTGKVYDSADSFTVSATGEHTWDEGVVTTQPTTTSEGVKTFTCTVCEHTRTESIPKLDPSGVKTGDSGILLWIALASAAALGGACLYGRKKREA